MRHRQDRPAVLMFIAVASITVACRDVTSGSSAAATGRSAEPTATTAASIPVGTTATAAPIGPSAEPPSASLAAEGGDAVVGQLGSYTWLDGGSDSPWLPGAPISVGALEPLTVAIGGGVPVADWSARRAPAGSATGAGAVALGGGGPPVAFTAPGPGTWSVQLIVRFAGDLGSATYYWQLAVR
jgi:hypothetical protein